MIHKFHYAASSLAPVIEIAPQKHVVMPAGITSRVFACAIPNHETCTSLRVILDKDWNTSLNEPDSLGLIGHPFGPVGSHSLNPEPLSSIGSMAKHLDVRTNQP
jgi:hypothetical protein